jgi:hypothetical protein
LSWPTFLILSTCLWFFSSWETIACADGGEVTTFSLLLPAGQIFVWTLRGGNCQTQIVYRLRFFLRPVHLGVFEYRRRKSFRIGTLLSRLSLFDYTHCTVY